MTSKTSKRIKLGEPWDGIFGGGIMAGSVTLLSGPPGAGKTTLALQLARAVAKAKRGRAVYLKRGKGRDDALTRAGAHVRCIPFSQAPIARIDATSLTVDGMAISQRTQRTMAVVRQLLAWARKHDAPVVIVAKATRDGDVEGPMALQRGCDAILTICWADRRDGKHSADERKIELWKNGSGPALMQPAWVRMTARGLVPVAARPRSAKKTRRVSAAR